MSFNIVNEKGEIIGWTASEFVPPSGQKLVPVGTQIAPNIDDVRKDRLTTIKIQVKQLLDDSAWRVERAAERDNLGIDGETPQEVYAYREAIRQAGDRAEKELEALDNIDDINAYQFEIRPSDYPMTANLTHLQFLRRFGVDERAKINELRAKSPQINDYFTLLELAKFVNPYDPDVILGVNTLEQMGIIAQGRAGQILNGEGL